MTVSTEPKQMDLDFGVNYSEIVDKEREKAINSILKGMAVLGVSTTVMNGCMRLIATEVEEIEYHMKDE